MVERDELEELEALLLVLLAQVSEADQAEELAKVHLDGVRVVAIERLLPRHARALRAHPPKETKAVLEEEEYEHEEPQNDLRVSLVLREVHVVDDLSPCRHDEKHDAAHSYHTLEDWSSHHEDVPEIGFAEVADRRLRLDVHLHVPNDRCTTDCAHTSKDECKQQL